MNNTLKIKHLKPHGHYKMVTSEWSSSQESAIIKTLITNFNLKKKNHITIK